MIAKIDILANDTQTFKMGKFPTIYFAPSNNKTNLIRFEGEGS